MNGKVKCIQDEIPFEIPESWVWCRLGNIFNVIMGQSPLGNSISEFIDGIEFHQGKLFFGNKYLKNSNAKTTMPTKISNENSVLLCIRAPVGKVNINKRKICIGRGLCSIEHNKYFLYELLYYFLLNFEQYFIYKSTGSTFKSITNEVVMNLILPIPPLKEQNNIVIKCNELLDLIDNIQKEYDNTNKIKKSLKNKLLDFIFSPNSSYKSYYEKGYTIENDAEILDNLRKPINATEREQRLSKSKDRYPYYGATGQVGFINEYLIEGDYVLVGEDGAPFLDKYKKKAYIIDGKSWVNNHAHILESKSNNKFLMYYLNWFNYQDYVSGTTRLKLTQGNLRKIPFINISKAEKDKIVKKLDKIFELIDNM